MHWRKLERHGWGSFWDADYPATLRLDKVGHRETGAPRTQLD